LSMSYTPPISSRMVCPAAMAALKMLITCDEPG
jgi:hypothetical protein